MYSRILQRFNFNTPQKKFVGFPLAFAVFALSSPTHAVTPPPDGGYSNDNTAEGDDALFSLTVGLDNTAIGAAALNKNTKGNFNVAIGKLALFSNIRGNSNTAAGDGALLSNTTGNNNTASGASSLQNNQNGINNTASGFQALLSNLSGSNNVANGVNALSTNTDGNFNAVNGVGALKANTHGSNNTADGYRALFANTSGSNNIAIGSLAGSNLTTGSNNIDVAAAGEAQTMRLGQNGMQTNTYIAGISGVTVAGGVHVIIDSTGHLGTIVSSKRFKENVQPMDETSEAIFSLQPVTFRYKHELDPNGIPQFGLVAEEVEKVNPDLVVRGEDGKVTTVRYEAVNAMLLNEFLKEHRKVEEQERKAQQQDARLVKQETTIARQQQQIEALTATVQKVSEKIELNKTTPQLVADLR